MARTFTLGTLVSRAQELADLENATNITSTMWKAFFSTQYGELHGLVAESGLRHFESRVLFSTTTDLDAEGSAPLPADFLSLVWAAEKLSDGRRRPLTQLMAQEQIYEFNASVIQDASYFAMAGPRLYLMPRPPTGRSYELCYVPQPADLTAAADATAVDVISPAGEGFLLWGVVVRATLKQDKDPRFARDERDEAKKSLMEWAALRSMHSRRRPVVDDGSGWFSDPADWRP